MKTINIFYIVFTLAVALLAFFACNSAPKAQFLMEAITPPPKTLPPTEVPKVAGAVPTAAPTPTKPPKIVDAKVMRVVGNPQATAVFLQVGYSTRGIKVGLTGRLFNDKGMTQEIGTVKITTVQKNISQAKVVEVRDKVNKANARVRFEIPQ